MGTLRITKHLSALLLFATLLPWAAGAPAEAARPQPVRNNIVLIAADGVGWNDLAEPFWKDTVPTNRLASTPNLQWLAMHGIKFTSAYASTEATPSRLELLTGRNDLSIARSRHTADSPDPGLPDLLAKAGYRIVPCDPDFISPQETIESLDAAIATAQPFFLYFWGHVGGPADIEAIDRKLGPVIAWLNEHRLFSSTTVVFVSASGSAATKDISGDHPQYPLRGGRGTAFEGGIRVPLIVVPPCSDSVLMHPLPRTCGQTVVTIRDLMPTLLAQAGMSRRFNPRKKESHDLTPLFTGGTVRWRSRPLVWHSLALDGEAESYSILRQGDWKLIYYYSSGHTSLFNLGEDLSEIIDHGENPVQAKRREQMARTLTRTIQKARAPIPEGACCPDGSEPKEHR